MFDLKPYYDAAAAADEEVQRVMADMNAAFSDGTEEGKTRALAMRPALEEAKAKAKEANGLYLDLREAASIAGAAGKFVPVNPQTSPERPAENGLAKGEMKREDFIALGADERMKFVRGGGKVVDNA